LYTKRTYFTFDTLIAQQYLLTKIFLNVVFKCNALFNWRLQFNNMVLRKVFGGKMEKLTGG